MPSNKTRHPMAAAHAPCVFDDAPMLGFPNDEDRQLMRWEGDGGSPFAKLVLAWPVFSTARAIPLTPRG
jgi:hypothetical protein